jgi:hypothetical protein
VSTVIAVDIDCLHSRLSSLILDLGKTSILPRVLSGVGEDNLVSSDVKATVPLVVETDSGGSNGLIEDVLAPLEPVVGTEKL